MLSCPLPATRWFLLALTILVAVPAGRCQTASLVGTYSSSFDGPVIETARDGARKQIGTNRLTNWLQLNADGTLRTAFTSTFGGDVSSAEGVWRLQDGRLYFVIAAVPRPHLKSDSRWLGAPRVGVTDTGIRFLDVAGAGLGPLQFSRVDAAMPGSFPSLAEMPALQAMLAQIAAATPSLGYAGVASEQALKAIVHHAVATKDITALTRMTYPLLAGVEPEPEFCTYMQYMNWLAFGTPQVKDVPAEQAANELAQLQRDSGDSFPASVSARGMFLIGRASANGGSSFSGIYYGVVGGRWAILGTPYRKPPAGK